MLLARGQQIFIYCKLWKNILNAHLELQTQIPVPKIGKKNGKYRNPKLPYIYKLLVSAIGEYVMSVCSVNTIT